MRIVKALLGCLAVAGVGACAVAPPSGPDVTVLPGQGKSYAAFRQDDNSCRGAAAQSIGYRAPAQAANQSAVNSAVTGTALGAAAGALIGAAAGNPGVGAAIGAGSGLLVGSATGADAAQQSAGQLQRRYDMTYVQCMAAQGNKVPDPDAPAPAAYPYAPPPAYYPYAAYPPPYGYYYPGYAYAYPSFGFYAGGGWGHGRYHHR